MSDGKDSTKNKFELDRPDCDSHVNRAERYLISLVVYIYWMKSTPFLLNAKLWPEDHMPLLDYK